MSENESSSPREQILFLARGESRVKIIEALEESGSATQRDLRGRLQASRTTVSRALQSLTEKDWVEKVDSEYRLTRAGEIIAERFTRTLDTARRVDTLREFLRWFPTDVSAPDFVEAEGVELTYATDADPYAPARKQSEILRTTDRLRLLLPAIDLESTETTVEEVTEGDLTVETVVPPGVEATMESDDFAPLIREKVRTGQSAVFVSRTDVPFYLGLADDGRVQVGLADGDGLPRALLETTDGSIRDWAESIYQDYHDGASRKSAVEF